MKRTHISYSVSRVMKRKHHPTLPPSQKSAGIVRRFFRDLRVPSPATIVGADGPSGNKKKDGTGIGHENDGYGKDGGKGNDSTNRHYWHRKHQLHHSADRSLAQAHTRRDRRTHASAHTHQYSHRRSQPPAQAAQQRVALEHIGHIITVPPYASLTDLNQIACLLVKEMDADDVKHAMASDDLENSNEEEVIETGQPHTKELETRKETGKTAKGCISDFDLTAKFVSKKHSGHPEGPCSELTQIVADLRVDE